MKTLFLMRHAQADRAQPGMRDIDRPLSQRGRKDALLMGQYLQGNHNIPELILVSPALRVRETLNGVTEFFGGGVKTKQIDKLYSGGLEDYFEALRNLPLTVEHVMIIGHNPILEDMSAKIRSGTSGRSFLEFSPAAVGSFELPSKTWEELMWGTGEFKWMMKPGLLESP